VATLYAQVTPCADPISKRAILSALAPVAVPALLVAAIEVPVKDALLQLLKALL